MLQVEDSTEIGWLLYSTCAMDVGGASQGHHRGDQCGSGVDVQVY